MVQVIAACSTGCSYFLVATFKISLVHKTGDGSGTSESLKPEVEKPKSENHESSVCITG